MKYIQSDWQWDYVEANHTAHLHSYLNHYVITPTCIICNISNFTISFTIKKWNKNSTAYKKCSCFTYTCMHAYDYVYIYANMFYVWYGLLDVRDL